MRRGCKEQLVPEGFGNGRPTTIDFRLALFFGTAAVVLSLSPSPFAASVVKSLYMCFVFRSSVQDENFDM